MRYSRLAGEAGQWNTLSAQESRSKSSGGGASTKDLIRDIGSEIHRILKATKSGRAGYRALAQDEDSIILEEKEANGEDSQCAGEDCSASSSETSANSLTPLNSTRSDLPSPYEVWQSAQPAEVVSRVYHPVLSRREISEICDRMHGVSKEYQTKLEGKRLEQARLETEKLKFVPRINPRSKNLSSAAPIQERSKVFMEEREAKLQKARERQREEEMREVKAQPETLKSSRWEPRVAHKYIKGTDENTTESDEDYKLTFSPAITQKSCDIVAKAEKEGKRTSVWETPQHRVKSTRSSSSTSPTFTPRINNRSRSVSRPGKDVYDRLYDKRQEPAHQKKGVHVENKRQAVLYKRKYKFILDRLNSLNG